MIRYDCPQCGEHLAVAAARAGSTYVCGTCGADTTVPGERPAEPELSLAAEIAIATRRWSGRIVVVIAILALIGQDLIREALSPPAPVGSVQATPPNQLEAARTALRALADAEQATFRWQTVSDESINVQLTVADRSPTARTDRLVAEALDRMTRACPNITFVVEVHSPTGDWLGGSMRRGVPFAPGPPPE